MDRDASVSLKVGISSGRLKEEQKYAIVSIEVRSKNKWDWI
jgi:hypothetical protein